MKQYYSKTPFPRRVAIIFTKNFSGEVRYLLAEITIF
jgi:hypothetical protein